MSDSYGKKKPGAWTIWGVATSFYFLRVILFIAFGVFGSRIQAALAIGAGVFGSLGGFAYAIYGILQLPLGFMLDRFGARLILTLGCGACVTGAIIFALASNVPMALSGSVLIGGGSAIAYVGAMSLSRRLFSPSRFAYMVGLMIFIGSLGGASAQQLFGFLVKWESWRSIMLGIALCGVLVITLLWVIIPDNRGTRGPGNLPTRSGDLAALWGDLRQVLLERQIWLAGIYRGLTLGQMLSFGYVWDIPFQMAHYNDLSKSVAINSTVLIGFGIGSATIGWISDHVRRRVWPMRITALAMVAPMVLIIWRPMCCDWQEAVLLLIFGFTCGGAALGHAVGAESCPKRLTATALGLVSTIAYLIAGALQILPGVLLDMAPTYGSPAGIVCHYTIGQYCDSFLVFPIASICAFASALGIRESFPSNGNSI